MNIPPKSPPKPRLPSPTPSSRPASSRSDSPSCPPSPTRFYSPATPVDALVDTRYLDMRAGGSGITHYLDLGLPAAPAGSRPMTREEADATRHFQLQYDHLEKEERRFEYHQTYRSNGNGGVVPNQGRLDRGQRDYLAVPPGSYPPGTRIQIHSHPVTSLDFNAVPSLADFHVAHRNRTNAVHHPGTSMENALLYDPNTKDFYAYSGRPEAPDYKPTYLKLDPPPVPQASGAEQASRQKPLPRVPSSPSASSDGHASLIVLTGSDSRASSPTPSENSSGGRASLGHGSMGRVSPLDEQFHSSADSHRNPSTLPDFQDPL